VVGPGPLVVAPDLAAGQPSDAATRAGRALALQLLGVSLARGDGLDAAQVVVGALPAWIADEPGPAARAIAEVTVRRALFPGHPFAFAEPPADQAGAALWPFVHAAAAVRAGDVAVVMRHYEPWAHEDDDDAIARLRAGSVVAAEVAEVVSLGPLNGLAQEHARAVVEAALSTIEQLRDDGWRTVTGEAPGGARGPRGLDLVAERTESFDPLDAELGTRG
jgi:hypothetical protein